MRQPRRTDRYRPANLASASLPSWLDEETGRLDELEDPSMVELEPINIQGDPNAPEVVELAPFDIAGDVDAPPRRVGDYAPAPAGTRAPEEPKPMDGDWLDLVSTVLPEAVEDERTGLGGVEIPEWATRVIANDDGTMPTGALEAIGNLVNPAMVGGNMAGNIATQAALNASRDVRIAPEDRTVLAAPAAAGLANAGSLGFADDIAALLPEEVSSSAGISSSGDALRDQMRGGFDWAQREAPGSFAIGEDAAIAAQMAVPGAPLRAGASPTARALATGAEGALMGGLEGFGRSDAETVGGRLRDATPNAVMGGLVGGGMGALAGRANRNADVDPGELDDAIYRADVARMRQTGVATSPQEREFVGAEPGSRQFRRNLNRQIEAMREAGDFRGPLGLPATPELIQARLINRQRDAQRVMDEVGIEMSGQPVGFDETVGHISDRIDRLERIPGGGARRRVGLLSRELPQYQAATARPRQMGEGPVWEDLLEAKNTVQADARFGSTNPLQMENQDIWRALQRDAVGAVEQRNPQLADRLRQANRDYSAGEALRGIADQETLRASRNRTIGLTDTIALFGGGSMREGLQNLVLNRVIRGNENAISAINAERQVARIRNHPNLQRWASTLDAAAQRGPRAIAAALYLIQQRDPQARQAMQAEDEAPETQDMPEMQPEQPAPIEDVENVDLDDLFAEEPITDVENVDLEDLFQ